MAIEYRTPGVYVEEKSMLPPSVAGVATAIPAFIGYTEKQTNNPVQKVTSLIEYEALFGKGKGLTVQDGHVKGQEFALYDSMRLFFGNGGGTCYVASVGTFNGEQVTPTKTEYQAALAKVAQQSEVTILVLPDAALLLDQDALQDVQQAALDQCQELVGRFTILDVKMRPDMTFNTPSEQLDKELELFRSGVKNNLCFGAAYYPYLKTSYPKDIPFKEVVAALQDIFADNTDKQQLIQDAQTIVNLPDSDATKKTKMNLFIADSKDYAETLKVLKEEASVITPSGAIAGIYAAIDTRAGCWQAPANVGVTGAKDLAIQINDNQQAGMNVDPDTSKSVNAIRFFKGKGILVWGSRTLDGGSNEWRYVPVRRLFSYVEQSVKLSTGWVVFQPNDANTWVKVKCQISNFLSGLWRGGALAGATADDAFFVEVGKDITMTQDDINNGYLRVKIGLAAVRPAEFIILEFSHKVQE